MSYPWSLKSGDTEVSIARKTIAKYIVTNNGPGDVWVYGVRGEASGRWDILPGSSLLITAAEPGDMRIQPKGELPYGASGYFDIIEA